MKKILFFIPFYIMAINSFAQPPIANSYTPNNYINKFQGSWLWISGLDTIEIRLTKVKVTLQDPIHYADLLIGCQKYVNNGVVIESSMNRWDSIVQFNNYRIGSIVGWQSKFINDTSNVECSIKDYTKHTKHKLFLEYVPSTPPKLIWTLSETEGILVDPQQQIGLTLPASLILTKQ